MCGASCPVQGKEESSDTVLLARPPGATLLSPPSCNKYRDDSPTNNKYRDDSPSNNKYRDHSPIDSPIEDLRFLNLSLN